MKIVKRVWDRRIPALRNTDLIMQFGFMPGKRATNAIFTVRRIQEKLYMCFVDLEKAFDRVPRNVLEWGLRKTRGLVKAVMSQHVGAKTRLRVGSQLSEKFCVKAGVHYTKDLFCHYRCFVVDVVTETAREDFVGEIVSEDDLDLLSDNMEHLS